MPRLAKEVVEQRHNFIIKFFNDNPTMMGQGAWDAAGDAIFKASGMRMAPNTIIELFERAHAGGVKADAAKAEMVTLKVAKLAPGAPQVGVVSEDQGNLIAALRKFLAEEKAITRALREENEGLKAACALMRSQGKGIHGGVNLIDVPVGMTDGVLDSMATAIKG